MSRNKERLTTVDNALRLLMLFLRQPSISLAEAQRALGMSRTAVFRLAATLMERGFLTRDETTKLFYPGPMLARLALQHGTTDIVQLARPFMQELVRVHRESVYLSVRSGFSIVFIDGVESPERIRWASTLGEESEIYAGAAGKVHLAYMPERVVRSWLQTQELQRFTPATITDPEELLAELTRVREQGFAVSMGERFADAVGVSAPLFGRGREPICVLSLFLPKTRLKPGRLPELVDAVVACADKITQAIRLSETEFPVAR